MCTAFQYRVSGGGGFRAQAYVDLSSDKGFRDRGRLRGVRDWKRIGFPAYSGTARVVFLLVILRFGEGRTTTEAVR